MGQRGRGTAPYMNPEPQAEEPQEWPGGPDAVDVPDREDGPVSHDLPPDKNPGSHEAPDELTEPDDKSQDPDTGTSGEGDVPEEPPA